MPAKLNNCREGMIHMKPEAAERYVHPFDPLFSENSRILILGSFPSVKSREQQFFYGRGAVSQGRAGNDL